MFKVMLIVVRAMDVGGDAVAYATVNGSMVMCISIKGNQLDFDQYILMYVAMMLWKYFN